MHHYLMAWQGAALSSGVTDGVTLQLMECPSTQNLFHRPFFFLWCGFSFLNPADTRRGSKFSSCIEFWLHLLFNVKEFPKKKIYAWCRYFWTQFHSCRHSKERRAGIQNRNLQQKILLYNWNRDRLQRVERVETDVKKFSIIGIERQVAEAEAGSMLRSFLRQPVPSQPLCWAINFAFCTQRNFSKQISNQILFLPQHFHRQKIMIPAHWQGASRHPLCVISCLYVYQYSEQNVTQFGGQIFASDTIWWPKLVSDTIWWPNLEVTLAATRWPSLQLV